MINHDFILYISNKEEKNKLLPIDELFIENAIVSYERKMNKRPNRLYGGVLINKDFGIDYIYDKSIYPYLLHVGHTEDI